MQKSNRHKIVIIGCGNIAWHLAKHFSELKKYDLFIYNHRPNKALIDFKTKLSCTTETTLDKIDPGADFYFICVADKFVSSVSKKIKLKNPHAIVVHTSGSLKIDELGKRKNTAVFYPLQTFSKNDAVKWQEIPIVVETKNTAVKNKVLALAKQFSHNVQSLNYKERLTLHLSAVLVNNFTNALFVAAKEFVSTDNKNKFGLLLPLIKQTVLKLEKLNPLEAQTGPAKRGDTNVMKKHLKLLSDNSEMQKIYKQLSNLIAKQQTKKHA